MPHDLYFIDSNIPMYVDGREHPLKAPCARAASRLVEERIPCATSVEVIQEIVHRYSLIGRRQQARRLVNDFLAVVPKVLPVTVGDMGLMLSYVERFPDLSVRDLIHVAVMRNNGISAIISTDRDFDQVPEITRVDPVTFG